MKFEDAFNAAYDQAEAEDKKIGVEFAGVSSGSLKVMAFMWNMLAAADFVLDDKVHIVNDKHIISSPKEDAISIDSEDEPEDDEVEEKPKKGKRVPKGKNKGQTSTDETADIVDENGKKEEETTEPEPKPE